MKCCYCGAELNKSNICPRCGNRVYIWKKAQYISNRLYNDGLGLAIDRKLTMAVETLTLSLQYNKRNIDARNLLGLVYLEMGEYYHAFSEWTISLNFQPTDNIARDYLSSQQKTSNQIDRLNAMIRKYNQSLQFCRNNTFDLAKIQLRGVLDQNPKLVRGHLLLALILIHEEKYDEALKSLDKVRQIDRANPTETVYREECKKHLNRDGSVILPKEKKKQMTMQERIHEFQERPVLSSVVNVIIGAIAGALIVGFLVVPAYNHLSSNSQASKLRQANQTIAEREQQISTLEDKINNMQDKVDNANQNANDAEDTITSYQKLLSAYQKYRSNDYTGAGSDMEKVDRDLLDSSGKKIYDTIMSSVQSTLQKNYYNEGMNAYYSENYKSAVSALKKCTKISKSYNDYRAAYYLGMSYLQLKDEKNAKTWLTLCANNTSSSTYSTEATNQLNNLNSSDSSSSTDSNNTNN